MVVNHESLPTESYSRFRDFHKLLGENDLYAWEILVYLTEDLKNVPIGSLSDTIVANVPLPNMF